MSSFVDLICVVVQTTMVFDHFHVSLHKPILRCAKAQLDVFMPCKVPEMPC